MNRQGVTASNALIGALFAAATLGFGIFVGRGLVLAALVVALVLWVLFICQPESGLKVGLTIALVALVFMAPRTVGPESISLILAPAIAIGASAAGMLRAGRRFERPSGYRWLLAFYGVLLLSTIVNPSTDPYLVVIGLTGLTLFTVASQLREDEVQFVARGIVAIGLICAFLGLYENRIVNGPLVGSYSSALGENVFIEGVRSQATLGGPLVLGYVLIIAMIVLVGTVSMTFWTRLICLTVLLLGIVSTGSASALVIALLWIFITIFLRGTLIAKLVSATAALLVAIAIFGFGVLPERWMDAFTGKLTGVNARHRDNSIDAIPNLLFDQPSAVNTVIGHGWGSAESLYLNGTLPYDGFFAVDNQWVSTLIEGGYAAIIFLAAFLVVRLLRGNATAQAAILASVAMAFSFDLFSWASATALLMTCAGFQNASTDSAKISTPGQLVADQSLAIKY